MNKLVDAFVEKKSEVTERTNKTEIDKSERENNNNFDFKNNVCETPRTDSIDDLKVRVQKLHTTISHKKSNRTLWPDSESDSDDEFVFATPSASIYNKKENNIPYELLPKFRKEKGLQDPEEFLESFETICESLRIKKKYYVGVLIVCVDYKVAKWIKSNYKDQQPVNWEKFCKEFIRHYDKPNHGGSWDVQIRKLKVDNEGVQKYSDKFLELAKKLEWNLEADYALNQYKCGLPSTLLSQVTVTESSFKRANYRSNVNYKVSVKDLIQFALDAQATEEIIKLSNYDSKRFQNQHKHNKAQKPSVVVDKTPVESEQSDEPVCYYCKELGHKKPDCPVLQNKLRSSNKNNKKKEVKDEKPTVKRVALVESNVSIVSDSSNVKQVENNMTGVHTPCLINGIQVFGFVDGGATHSFISSKFVKLHELPISKRDGNIKQALVGKVVPRIGIVENVLLENGSKKLYISLEVADLSDNEDLIIGLNLFSELNYEIRNIPITWPQAKGEDKVCEKEVKKPQRPSGVDENGIHPSWKKILEDNLKLDPLKKCTLAGAEFEIRTDCPPIWKRQYAIPQKFMEATTAQIMKWAEKGVIVRAPPNCQWNLSIMVVPKRNADGTMGVRVCLDARPLNENLISLVESDLPLPRDIIDKLMLFIIFTVLDLSESYLQFPIKKEDQVKTAFTWNGVQWMFTGVPFGLRDMPNHMQRFMARLLAEFKVTPFIDDMPMGSTSPEEHFELVRKVLEKITYEAQLRLNIPKCKFCLPEVKVLGIIISSSGMTMDPVKVKAISEWPRPVDGKAMQRFLGAANFHREFSHKFAEIAAPLEELRNVVGPIEWSSEQIIAFEKLKELFLSNLKLKNINWDEDIYLTTDASLIGAGAWIGQKDETGTIIPVNCASKKLSPAQTRWSATKRELWALMWGMNKFRHYLLGRHFYVRVDHKPLVPMMTNKPNLLLEGWVDDILEYTFSTIYIPGKDNYLADALSRQHEVISIKTINIDEPVISSTAVNQTLLMEAEKRGKIIPSVKEQNQLLDQAHHLGHFSTETMFRQLWNQGYWWPGIRTDLKKRVSSCIDCLRFDIVQAGYHPLQSIEAKYPWDHIEIDLIGPLPISEEGYCFVLTITDVMSGYTVLRALTSKTMEEMVKVLWSVFCEYGTPKILQSDNGTEFINQLIDQLVSVYGIDHRVISPYHPRANGLVERKNKEVTRGLKKYLVGCKDRWQDWLPIIQLGLNIQELKRTGSSPFALMHGRSFNNFRNFEDIKECKDLLAAVQDRLSTLAYLKSVVFPAVEEKVHKYRKNRNDNFNNSNRILEDLPPGAKVMMVNLNRTNKLEPYYVGPYTIVRKNQGGAYILQDITGGILEQRVAPDLLKIIDSSDSMVLSEEGNVSDDDIVNWEVERIIKHRMSNDGGYEYLVSWKNLNKDCNSWVNERNFNELKIIDDYWKQRLPKDKIKKKVKFSKTKKVWKPVTSVDMVDSSDEETFEEEIVANVEAESEAETEEPRRGTRNKKKNSLYFGADWST